MLSDFPFGQRLLTRNNVCEFELLESYKSAHPRLVIGQQFADDPDHVHPSRQRTPPGFSNLLPEGPLRQLIARWAGVPVHRKFFLLHQLGEDLPDAVRIVADDTLEQSTEAAASRREDDSRF